MRLSSKINEKLRVTRLLLLLAVAFTMICAAVVPAKAAKIKPTSITAVGKKTRTVYTGKEFELEVKMSSKKAEDDYLKWQIVSGSKYVRFEDNDRTGDDMEFKAVKAGTAKIRCTIKGTSKKVDFTVNVKAAPKKITAVGKTSRTVKVGKDFELEVNKYSGLKDKNLKWSIGNTKIVCFEDRDRTGDEVEFEAVKTGKTTITCKDSTTGQKVTFTITVVKK